MLVEIDDLLQQAQLDKIDQILAQAEFVDGKLTAGKAAQRVKNNQELKGEPRQMELLIRILTSAMANNATFRSAVLPYRMADPIFARYQPGMTYGDHVDDPLMGLSGQRFRSDVSMTIFLREPETYEGGELVVRTTFGEKRVKLPAGSAVIYPSSSLHHVAEVTKGERLVALAWIQSYVRDPAQRELLYELDQAREHLLATAPDTESTGLVDKSYANLLRMWGDV
ncbi:MAG: Fe2+-dependent dioxygenase [Candidatus Thiodiazotropha endolucinida]|uniref:Fe2+-dependent dioxygenase n=1 Tax=Candidatus Thiodiazotropha taylori TaxID=2792791 RepID=A0A9E4NYP8_9GAMM|nr:Fe2+-dependent dioxygenase [Candidatus Thiodiazotropha sp. (ex Lucina pensylvanica)]MCG7979059.1 Fe2+-dependent dioxygenase [Candidatus Thiodiazotropha taylori]MCG8096082.1 Fe2+-dependent dioxygenase [Candidatus Thiodiazotropha endolucinida]MCG8048154.1 Fe2+-dependent dioxygenase [Candidatus Thiodiazotropha taylori]MCG8059648.1 Fe2+-dependent dioxygenase [Candidatus Thiodiazotropha taylori]